MDAAFKKWAKNLPVSKMAYPPGWQDRLKYLIWAVLRPLHPFVRTIVMGVPWYERRYEAFRPGGRQEFLLGTLAPGVTPQALIEHLVQLGFGNHFVALKDRGEVISLRYSPSFKHQYHIRIFDDKEVRGHFEYTVECHPFWHDRQVGFEPRRQELLRMLGPYIVPTKPDKSGATQ